MKKCNGQNMSLTFNRTYKTAKIFFIHFFSFLIILTITREITHGPKCERRGNTVSLQLSC